MDRIVETLVLQPVLSYRDNKQNLVRIHWQPAPPTIFSTTLPPTLVPSSILVPKYGRDKTVSLSLTFRDQLKALPARRFRDRLNAAINRPSARVSVDGIGLEKQAVLKVLAWMDYMDDWSIPTLNFSPEQPLVDAFKQKRAASTLRVERLVESLDKFINSCLAPVPSAADIKAVIAAFGPKSEEAQHVLESAVNALVYEWRATRPDDRSKIDDLNTLILDDAEFAAAVKRHVIAQMKKSYRQHPNFEASREYQELMANSAIFQKAVNEEWMLEVESEEK